MCNFRPGFVSAPRESAPIELSVLSPAQTRQQLVSLLDGVEPPEDLVQSVVERTDGNPFFVEEIVNRLLETQPLAADDGWQLQRSLDDGGIPGRSGTDRGSHRRPRCGSPPRPAGGVRGGAGVPAPPRRTT